MIEKDTYNIGFKINNISSQAYVFALFHSIINVYRNSPITTDSGIYPPTYNYEALDGSVYNTGEVMKSKSIIFEDNPTYLNAMGIDCDFVVTTPLKSYKFYINNNLSIEKITGNWDILRKLATKQDIVIQKIIIRSEKHENFEKSFKFYDISPEKTLSYEELPVQDSFDPKQYQSKIVNINKEIIIKPTTICTFSIIAQNSLDISFVVKKT